jgi:hypothetical protein
MSSVVECAKDIRRDLKDAFPGVKFRVTAKTFSGGNSVNVHWTYGPSLKSVEKIVDPFQCGYFDGSEDLYHYVDTGKPNTAKWVICNRQIPDFERIKEDFIRLSNYADPEKNFWNIQSLIHRILTNLSFPSDSYQGLEMIPDSSVDLEQRFRAA